MTLLNYTPYLEFPMKSWTAIKAKSVAIVTCLVLSVSLFAKVDAQEDLAKESQNPIGNIISLPFENNFDFGVGPKAPIKTGKG